MCTHSCNSSNLWQGCTISGLEQDGFKEAVAAAESADAVVLVVGLDQTIEREGKDRYSLRLPGVQNLLIEVVSNAAKGPVVVVFMNGGAVDASDVLKNSKVHAILGVGYPGQSGGQGLADVLFGTYNPAGRLTQTWYHANYVDMVCKLRLNLITITKLAL